MAVLMHPKDQKDTEALAESFTGMLLNMGVIGALILTMVFPLLLAPEVEPSQSAKDFFTEDGALALRVVYQVLLAACFGMAAIVIFRSIRMYTAVNFWMPTVPSKRWFMDRFTLVPLVILCVVLILSLVLTVLLGASVNASPRLGLMMALCLVAFIVALYGDGLMGLTCVTFLHRMAHEGAKLTGAASRSSKRAWT
jgi:hypothetical protein